MKKNIKVISTMLGMILLISTAYIESVSALNRSEIEQKVLLMTEGKEFDMTRVIVKYKDVSYGGASVASINGKVISQVKDVDANSNLEIQNYASATAGDIQNVQDTLIQLLLDPNVEYAEPNYLGHTVSWVDAGATSAPSDYNISNHWYYNQSKVREMWDDQLCGADGAHCGGGEGDITVAVIDTGLAFESHDDSGEYNSGTNKVFTAVGADYNPANGFNIYVNSNEIAGDGRDNDCNGVIDDYNGFDAYAWYTFSSTGYYYPGATTQDFCYGSTPYNYGFLKGFLKMGHPVDTYGHGSYVTGLISGVVDNVSGTGSVSPAHNINIMPIAANVPFTGDFWSSEVLSGIYYATAHGADVINMSLGGFSYTTSMQNAINYAHTNGVVIVAASGNENSSTVSYPGAFDNVIAVGSVNSNDTKSSYSNYGADLDVVAYVGDTGVQGGATWQETLNCMPCDSADAFNTTSVQYGVGTSYASPQVAAAGALILSVNPDLTSDEVASLITSTASDIASYGVGWDSSTGYGVLDFEALWTSASDNGWVPPVELGYTITTPEMIAFGGDLYVFKMGADYSLKMNIYDGSTWSGWTGIGYTTAPPTAEVIGGNLYIAKKGTDNSVKVRSFDGSIWSEWELVGAGITLSNPVLSSYGTDLYISKRGAQNELKLNSYDGSTWSGWDTIGYAISPPAMVEYSGDLYVFKRGGDETLKVSNYDGSTWSIWEDIGGVTTNTPVAVVHNGLLYAAKRGGDNGVKVQSFDGSTWAGWTIIGNASVSPAMNSFGGNLYISKNGADGLHRVKYFDNSVWSDWVYVGTVKSKPVMIDDGTTLYLLNQEKSGKLTIQEKE